MFAEACAAAAAMIILVMGMSGAGKTTVGRLLASRLGWEFIDGDDHHPEANVNKMRSGIPLTDADRAPWLESLRALMVSRTAAGKNAVVACSALKQAYRETLRLVPDVYFVYLKGTASLLRERLRDRVGHFMSPAMLESQLAVLEEPADSLVIDVAQSPDEIVMEILVGLGSSKP